MRLGRYRWTSFLHRGEDRGGAEPVVPRLHLGRLAVLLLIGLGEFWLRGVLCAPA